MRITALLFLAALLPTTTFAEAFTTARDVRLPVLAQPSLVLLELDEEARRQSPQSLRLIDGESRAVGFARADESQNLMSEAIFDAIPIANDASDNTVDNLRDGSASTVFQPVVADSFRFRFHFVEPVSPVALEYVMDTANVSNVQVRVGNSFATLHDVFAGPPPRSHIELSGEAARAFEVTFTTKQGVPRVGEMKLLQPRSTLLFRAVPQQQYTLLYGGPARVQNPVERSVERSGAPVATLGASRRATTAEKADHDGIDAGDNCPDIWNPEQKDGDGDVIGDGCDNCPAYPNSTQLDANGNGIGDPCEDPDRDGVANAIDNCPDARNSTQRDVDSDGVGDACDEMDERLTSGGSWFTWVGVTIVLLLLFGIGVKLLRGNE